MDHRRHDAMFAVEIEPHEKWTYWMALATGKQIVDGRAYANVGKGEGEDVETARSRARRDCLTASEKDGYTVPCDVKVTFESGCGWIGLGKGSDGDFSWATGATIDRVRSELSNKGYSPAGIFTGGCVDD